MEPWLKFRKSSFHWFRAPKGLENLVQKTAIKSAQSSPNRPESQSSMQFYIRTHTKFRESQRVYESAILAPCFKYSLGPRALPAASTVFASELKVFELSKYVDY